MWGPSADDKFFNRVPMLTMVSIAAVFMAVTQLFITIWSLTYHIWWYFFALAAIIGAGAVLFLAIRTQNPKLVLVLLLYQVLFILLFLGDSINMLVRLCHPYANSYLFRYCWNNGRNGKSWEHCAKDVRIAGGVYSFIYLLFAVINALCLMVLYRFFLFIKDKNRVQDVPRYNPQGYPQSSEPQPAAGAAPPPVSPGPAQTPSNGGSFVSADSEQLPPAPQPYNPYGNQSPNAAWDNQPAFPPAYPQQQEQYNPYQNEAGGRTHQAMLPSKNSHLYDETPSYY